MSPIISPTDTLSVDRLMVDLPHALIIEAESGLDNLQLIDNLVMSRNSDVILLKPAPDKMQIAVEQIRDMIDSIKTFTNHRRIIIIRPAESMTESSQNALLKILEEPMRNLHFILDTENSSLLLPTVVSRCQTLILHRTTTDQDEKILAQQDINNQAKNQILFLASGRPNLIRQLVHDPGLFDSMKDIATDAKLIMKDGSYNSLATIYRYTSSRAKALQLIDVLRSILKFYIRSQGIDKSIQQLSSRLQEADEALKANGNVKLAMMRLVVK